MIGLLANGIIRLLFFKASPIVQPTLTEAEQNDPLTKIFAPFMAKAVTISEIPYYDSAGILAPSQFPGGESLYLSDTTWQKVQSNGTIVESGTVNILPNGGGGQLLNSAGAVIMTINVFTGGKLPNGDEVHLIGIGPLPSAVASAPAAAPW
jgi:hypothetical protein